MSTSGLESEPGGGAPTRRSGWAIAALLCSLGLFCPPLILLGPLLAIRALVQLRSDADRTGKGMAVAAILIGLLGLGVWTTGGVWWHLRVRQPMMHGPITALQAGLGGDLQGFRNGFTGAARAAENDEIRAFLGELDNRYGSLRAMDQRHDDAAPQASYQMQSYRIPYVMEFETGPINAEARFIIVAPDGDGFVGRFAWLAVYDPEQGDLLFPASAASEVFPTADAVPDAHDAN